MSAARDTALGIFQYLLHLALFKLSIRYISSIRATNPSHQGPG
jgi:hypothetical protein